MNASCPGMCALALPVAAVDAAREYKDTKIIIHNTLKKVEMSSFVLGIDVGVQESVAAIAPAGAPSFGADLARPTRSGV